MESQSINMKHVDIGLMNCANAARIEKGNSTQASSTNNLKGIQAESGDASRLKKRIEVTINVLEDLGRRALFSRDIDQKIALLNKAKPLSDEALKMLKSLPKTVATTQQLEMQTHNRGQIAIELTKCYLRQEENLTHVEDKIALFKKLYYEIEDVLHTLKALPGFKIPHGILDEFQLLKLQNQANLMSVSRTAARDANSSVDKKKYYRIALSANKVILENLRQMPKVQKSKKNILGNYLWDEWIIKSELEQVIFDELSLVISDVMQTVAQFNAEKASANFQSETIKNLEDKISQYLKCINEVSPIQKSLYKKYQEMQHASSAEQGNSNLSKEHCQIGQRKIRVKLMMGAMLESQFKTTLAFHYFEHLQNTLSPEMNNLVSKWIAVNEGKLCLLIGSVNCITSPIQREKLTLSVKQEIEIMSSVFEQCQKIEEETNWILECLKSKSSSEIDTDHWLGLRQGLRVFIDALQFELDIVKSAFNEKSLLADELPTKEIEKEKSLKPNLHVKSDKQQSKNTGDNPGKKIHQKKQTRIIKTRFDGKLIGKIDGELVIVENMNNELVKYHREGKYWGKLEKEDEEVAANILAIEKDLNESKKQERCLKRIFKMIDKAEITVLQKRKSALEYSKLSEFSAKSGAPLSQSLGIYKLAQYYQEQAISLFKKIISSIENHSIKNDDIKDCIDSLKQQIQTIKEEMYDMRQRKINSIKNQSPSGAALQFLLDENQVSQVIQTIDKKKLKGIEVTRRGVVSEDYLDEHEIHLHDDLNPLILHTHFNKKNALIEENTACHLKYEDECGIENRSPVRNNTLQRIYAFNGA